jgi:hypothetical protein
MVCLATVVSQAACIGPGNMNPADLTARERAVRVFRLGERPDCEYTELGTVEATSGTSWEMGTYESSLAKMKRDTARLGGNGVMLTDHFKNQMADRTSGTAIRCH